MAKDLNELVLGYAGAIVSAACMLLLGIGANIGVYSGAAVQMQKWHMFFDFTMFGIFTGMLEAAFWSFIALYTFGWIYNKYA